MMVTLGLGEDLQWRHPTQILVWQMIIQPIHMSNCKFPQPNIICVIICPIKGCMYHHLPIPIANSSNFSIRFAILMLGTNTREILSLFLPLTIREEVIQNKYAIVRMITIGHYASQIPDLVFKLCFSKSLSPHPPTKLEVEHGQYQRRYLEK